MYRPTPNLVQRIHLTQRIAAVVDVLEEEGISSSRTLTGTGLKSADLRSPDTRVSYRQVETVFRNATRLSNDPAIAFRAEAGVVGRITDCKDGWCLFNVKGRKGWIETDHIWGD